MRAAFWRCRLAGLLVAGLVGCAGSNGDNPATNACFSDSPVKGHWGQSTDLEYPLPAAIGGVGAAWSGAAWFLWGGDPDLPRAAGLLIDPDSGVGELVPESQTLGARKRAAVFWTGDRFGVWGGRGRDPQSYALVTLQTGALLDRDRSTWEPMPIMNAPSARSQMGSVVGDDKLFVWGGTDRSTEFKDGAYFDFSAEQWSPMNPEGAPMVGGAAMVWTGTRLLVWGGLDNEGIASDVGASYDPRTDSWMPMSSESAPSARTTLTAVWSGTEMIVFGGLDRDANPLGDGAAYNPLTDSWRPLSLDGAPASRSHYTAVWTGQEMFIFGGEQGCPVGGLYNPETDTWRSTPVEEGTPPPTRGALSTWTGSEVLIYGGVFAGQHRGYNHVLSRFVP